MIGRRRGHFARKDKRNKIERRDEQQLGVDVEEDPIGNDSLGAEMAAVQMASGKWQS